MRGLFGHRPDCAGGTHLDNDLDRLIAEGRQHATCIQITTPNWGWR
ncbi:MAG TPA: hypothetical protein VN668_20635 [Stellaceae bacterium]|nr:hypothetical protein [Stellaceae bacterium]